MNSGGSFPYHQHCGYCADRCIDIDAGSSYILITNFWNEHDHIEQFFLRISQQSIKPKVWLWIDDGSTDGSSNVVKHLSKNIPGVEVWLKSMPTKMKGNLDTIGRAYDNIIPALLEKLEEYRVDYVAIMDTDNDPCPNYSARMMWLLNNHPRVGAAAGIPLGEEDKRKAGLPMGGGKFIRWSIFHRITKYWDIAPDTLLNIKALAYGYTLKTWPVPMNLDALTTGFTSKGVFRQGRLNYYVGRPFWAVFFRALRRLILGQHGTQFLRGYLQERNRRTWRFQDPDVSWYYGKGRNPVFGLLDLLRYVRSA